MAKSKAARSGVVSPIKRHGGKGLQIAKILPLLPPVSSYDVFLSAYCGGAQVEIARPQLDVREYLNDRDRELANFWYVLSQPECYRQFERRISMQPLSEELFQRAMAYVPRIESLGNVEAACHFFVKCRQSRQGLCRDYCTPTTRFRRHINEQVSAWLGAVDKLPEVAERLITAEVWNRPAIDAIMTLDGPGTFFYCDPPYIHYTRSTHKEYGEHEMTEVDHHLLLDLLSQVKGKFLLHGYPSPLYSRYMFKYGWNLNVLTVPNSASSKKKKTLMKECVWTNY